MIQRKAQFISFLMSFVAVQIPSYASVYQLKDEIEAYNRGDFKNAVFIGRVVENDCIGSDNQIARYYLANAYYKLNRTDEAMQEYRVCFLEGHDAKIKQYARAALDILENQSGSKHSPLQDNDFIEAKKRGGVTADKDYVKQIDAQYQNSNSSVQFVPAGSNRYVRNYVNYDGEPPAPPMIPELKAVQKTFISPKPLSNTQRKP